MKVENATNGMLMNNVIQNGKLFYNEEVSLVKIYEEMRNVGSYKQTSIP